MDLLEGDVVEVCGLVDGMWLEIVEGGDKVVVGMVEWIVGIYFIEGWGIDKGED